MMKDLPTDEVALDIGEIIEVIDRVMSSVKAS